MTLHKFKMISKPFWVPAIALIYILRVDYIDPFVITALCFGYIGDILLMIPRKRFFIAGAFSFMVGHLFYIAVFIIEAGGFKVFSNHPIACALFLLPYICVIILMKNLLGKNISSILLPATCYLSILLLMSYSALIRQWEVPQGPFLMSFLGSILFIISDLLIAVRKFKTKFRGIGTVVVFTYIAAQLLIINGLV